MPPAPDEKISLREYVERIIDERDRLNDVRLKALESMVIAAFAAHEKAVTAAFAAAETAVGKAEIAQKEYNARSNEFRGQLDDQAKLLMPRAESVALHSATGENLQNLRDLLDSRIDGLMRDLHALRDTQLLQAGKAKGLDATATVGAFLVGTLIALASAYAAFHR